MIWAAGANIATVTVGKWGDDYPALRFAEGEQAGSIGATVEAYMEQITYGEIPEEVAKANAALIVHSVNALPSLVAALRLGLELQRPGDIWSVDPGKMKKFLAEATAALALAAKAQPEGSGE